MFKKYQVEQLQADLDSKANISETPIVVGWEQSAGCFLISANGEEPYQIEASQLVLGTGNTATNLWTGATITNAIAAAQKTVIGIVSKTASFTLATSDAGKYIRYDSVNEGVCTVPAYSTLQIPANTVITIRQAGAGILTLQAGSGATLNGSLKTAGQHKSLQLINVTGDVWDVVGGVD